LPARRSLSRQALRWSPPIMSWWVRAVISLEQRWFTSTYRRHQTTWRSTAKAARAA